MTDLFGSDHNPYDDPLNNPSVRGTYSLWHRLASEALVYISTREDPARDDELLNVAQRCAERALSMSDNDMQEELTGKLLEAVERMRTRVLRTDGEGK